MEGEVFLMDHDGNMVSMVKIPEGTQLPDVIMLQSSDSRPPRLFIVKAGVFMEAVVMHAHA